MKHFLRAFCYSLVTLTILFPPQAAAQTAKAKYLTYLKQAAQLGWDEHARVLDNWKRNQNPNPLWGYDAPGHPVYLADVMAFLYAETEEIAYGDKAKQLLLEFGKLKDLYPQQHAQARVEYQNGVPALANFFFLPAYSRAYMRIRHLKTLDEPTRQTIEEQLAQSLDFVFHFPEWGAMNRTMLRAEGLNYGSIALPDHARSQNRLM